MRLVHRLSVAAAQEVGLVHVGVLHAGVLDAVLGKCDGGDGFGQVRHRVLVEFAHEALGFGEHMGLLPPRPGFGDDADHFFGAGGDPFVGDAFFGAFGAVQTARDHGCDSARAAQCLDRFGAPGLTFLGVGAQFFLVFAGFQGGLLRDRHCLGGGGFAAVHGLKFFGQFADALLDGLAPRRPFLDQFVVHTYDFADRTLTELHGPAVFEPHL
ncbi:Uncharacterised protein [Mycobacteroides abscessus subsp. abscessus]|nr:Uncharacterised protein [Mycobacteroides abscessus subsp. abscessus]SKW97053.1 Uncharacterised protein [Mycobacteroides abscessus subsp. abscessus]